MGSAVHVDANQAALANCRTTYSLKTDAKVSPYQPHYGLRNTRWSLPVMGKGHSMLLLQFTPSFPAISVKIRQLNLIL